MSPSFGILFLIFRLFCSTNRIESLQNKCWESERTAETSCNDDNLLTMIIVNATPVDINLFGYLKTRMALTNFNLCTQECYNDPQCYISFVNSKGCNLLKIGEVTMLRKVNVKTKFAKVAIKIHTNKTTCQLSKEELLTNQTFNVTGILPEFIYYQIDTTETGYHIFGKSLKAPENNCPSGWTLVKESPERKCIRYIQKPMESMLEAQKLCQSGGAILAPIVYSQEFKEFNKIVNSLHGKTYRIGLYRKPNCDSSDNCFERSAYISMNDSKPIDQSIPWETGFPTNVESDSCVAVKNATTLINIDCGKSPLITGFMCAINQFADAITDDMLTCEWDNNRLNGAHCRPECYQTMITVPGRVVLEYSLLRNSTVKDFEGCQKSCFDNLNCYAAFFDEKQGCVLLPIGNFDFIKKDRRSKIAIKITANSTTCGMTTDELLNNHFYKLDNLLYYNLKSYRLLPTQEGWLFQSFMKNPPNDYCSFGWTLINLPRSTYCAKAFDSPVLKKYYSFGEARQTCKTMSGILAPIRSIEEANLIQNVMLISSSRKAWVGIRKGDFCIGDNSTRCLSDTTFVPPDKLKFTGWITDPVHWEPFTSKFNWDCGYINWKPTKPAAVRNTLCDDKSVTGFVCAILPLRENEE